jgi:hypothetical protein
MTDCSSVTQGVWQVSVKLDAQPNPPSVVWAIPTTEARRATDLVEAGFVGRASAVRLERALVDVVTSVVAIAGKASWAVSASAATLFSAIHTWRSADDICANDAHIAVAVIGAIIGTLVDVDAALRG